MNKNDFLNNWKIVIEPKQERVEIPLSSFSPFVNAVHEVSEDYEISVDDVERFMERHIEDFEGMIGQKISIKEK